MKFLKKLSALYLAVLIAGMPLLPLSAFAEEAAETEEVEVDMEQIIQDALLEGEDTETLLGEEDIETEGAVAAPETEKENQEEEIKNISELIEAPKLSGVDFVNVYEESFEALRKNLLALGIFTEADTDGDVILTRAEFAVLISKILNNGMDATDSAHRYEFKDVDSALLYAPAINMLSNYAIVEGDGNGYFYPENELKGGEAIIMLLNTLGYYEIAHIRGEGDAGYRNLAIDMKFTKDVPFSYEKTVDLKTAAKLIYRALHEKVAGDLYYSGENVTFTQSDETLMHRYMDVLTIEGVVTANEYTSLYAADANTSENCIEINDNILLFTEADKEPYNYLGLYSRVYFREDSGKNTAIFIEALDNRYELLKINANDVERYDFNNRRLHYTENESSETEDIPVDLAIIFNNELVEGNINEHYFTPDAGQLVFIDNNRDGKYDLLIIDSYSTYVVKSSVTNNNLNLYDELSMQDGLNLEDKTIKVYKNNVKAAATDIAAGDIVFAATEKVTFEQAGTRTYQKLDTAGSEKIRLLASNYALSGRLESLAEEYLYIDNVEYEYSKSFLAASEIGENSKAVNSRRIGVSVTGAYDLNGDIAWILRGSDENVKYAFLVRVAEGKTSFNPNVMKFFSQDGKMETAEFDNKVKVFTKWDSGDINSSTYYSRNIGGKDIVTDVPGLIANNKTVRQLIRYKLNDEGKITQLYLAAADDRDYKTDVPLLEENILYLSTKMEGDTSYFAFSSGATGVMSSYFTYRKNMTYGFKVPHDENIEEEKYFRAFTPSNDESAPFTHNSKPNNLELYNIDGGIIGAFLHYDTSISSTETDTGKLVTCGSSGPSLVIENVKMVKNEETDEFVPVIDAWNQNKLTTYTFVNADLVSNIAYTKKNGAEQDDTLSLIHPSELHKGDIIVAHLNKFGEIDGFSVAHRPKYTFDNLVNGEMPMGAEKGYTSSHGGYYYNSSSDHMYISGYHRGRVAKTINGAPIVATQRTVTNDQGEDEVTDVFRRLILNSTQNQLLIYDYKNDTLTLTQGTRKCADFSQLEEGDYLFWHQKVFNTQTSVAVRNYQ